MQEQRRWYWKTIQVLGEELLHEDTDLGHVPCAGEGDTAAFPCKVAGG